MNYKLAVVSVALLSAVSANAASLIDQNAPTNNSYMAAFDQLDLAQSFKQTATNISGAGIFLQAGQGSTAPVTISLWDKLPNVAGAALLATSTATGTSGNWLDVFWSPLSIAAATTYYLVFSGNTSLGISGDASNGYAFGNVFANSGYDSFGGFDYTFRTYASDATGAVPEPASWAMMIAGFGLAGAAMRRRRSLVAA